MKEKIKPESTKKGWLGALLCMLAQLPNNCPPVLGELWPVRM